MVIRLFDVKDKKIFPTEHCYTLEFLKCLMEEYPENYIKIYQYLFYMTCPDPSANPFFNTTALEREKLVLSQIDCDFDPEDYMILQALEQCKKLYETPTVRAYNGISTMLDRLSKYMEDTPITAGRDGNITALLRSAKDFQDIRNSFKGVYQDLLEEQNTKRTRGGRETAYDQ
jgi:hypothetical protein